MTWEEAVYDIFGRLGITSDDSLIDEREVQCWIAASLGKVLHESYGQNIPGSVLKKECLEVNKDCGESVVTLPYQIFDLPDDSAITGVWVGDRCFDRTSGPSEFKIKSQTTFGSVIDQWYRIGDKVYLQGKNIPNNTKVTLILLPMDLDESFENNIPVSAHLVYDVLEGAEEIGRRRLGLPEDYKNDGKTQPDAR